METQDTEEETEEEQDPGKCKNTEKEEFKAFEKGKEFREANESEAEATSVDKKTGLTTQVVIGSIRVGNSFSNTVTPMGAELGHITNTLTPLPQQYNQLFPQFNNLWKNTRLLSRP